MLGFVTVISSDGVRAMSRRLAWQFTTDDAGLTWTNVPRLEYSGGVSREADRLEADARP
jgi:hypothetical protein